MTRIYRIVIKMTKRRFSYSHDLMLSLFTVFFDTSPLRLGIDDFLSLQFIVEMRNRELFLEE